MTQFILCKRRTTGALPAGVRFVGMDEEGDYFDPMLAAYSMHSYSCVHLVDDATDGADWLLDTVSDALRRGGDPEATPFGRAAKLMIDEGVPFVCWYADDWLELPTVRDYAEFMRVLVHDAALSPPEFWVHYPGRPE